jgi:hypothetical protein
LEEYEYGAWGEEYRWIPGPSIDGMGRLVDLALEFVIVKVPDPPSDHEKRIC